MRGSERARTCVGACGSGREKGRDLSPFAQGEREKEGQSFGVEGGYRGEEARKEERNGRREERERRRVGEFIVAAMMVAVSELAISESSWLLLRTESIYFLAWQNIYLNITM